MTKLKPCPFCGKTNKLKIHRRKHRDYPDGLYAVKCSRCNIRGRYQLKEERAITAWNTRAERTCEGCAYHSHPSDFWCENCSRYYADFYMPKVVQDAD